MRIARITLWVGAVVEAFAALQPIGLVVLVAFAAQNLWRLAHGAVDVASTLPVVALQVALAVLFGFAISAAHRAAARPRRYFA